MTAAAGLEASLCSLSCTDSLPCTWQSVHDRLSCTDCQNSSGKDFLHLLTRTFMLLCLNHHLYKAFQVDLLWSVTSQIQTRANRSESVEILTPHPKDPRRPATESSVFVLLRQQIKKLMSETDCVFFLPVHWTGEEADGGHVWVPSQGNPTVGRTQRHNVKTQFMALLSPQNPTTHQGHGEWLYQKTLLQRVFLLLWCFSSFCVKSSAKVFVSPGFEVMG